MKPRTLIGIAIVAIVVVLVAGFIVNGNGGNDADTVIYGTVYTADDDSTVAEAIAIKDGKFTYVGDEKGVSGFIGPDTEVGRLEGGAVLPGFIDSHCHVYKYFQGLTCGFNVMDMDLDKCIATIGQYVVDNPDLDFYWGYGLSEGLLVSEPNVKEFLDLISMDKPICIETSSEHMAVCNSAFFKLAGVDDDTPDPEDGRILRDKDGHLIGILTDEAVNVYVRPFLPEFSVEQYCAAILMAQEFYLGNGFTSYLEMVVNWELNRNLFDAYELLDDNGLLKIRVDGGWVIMRDGHELESIREAADLMEESCGGNFELTSVKFFIDGLTETKTALLLEPYEGEETFCGESCWGGEHKDLLIESTVLANKLGLSAHFHAYGDGAMQLSLDAVQASQDAGYNKVHNVFTHMQLMNRDQTDRMADLGIIASTNVAWGCKNPGYPVTVSSIGEERASNMYPYGYLRDSGVTMSFATDWPPGAEVSPIKAFFIATHRMDYNNDPDTILGPMHILTKEQTLHMMTMGGAYQMGDEGIAGSIEVGKQADLIVLDKDIMTCDDKDMPNAKILATMVAGEILFGEMQD